MIVALATVIALFQLASHPDAPALTPQQQLAQKERQQEPLEQQQLQQQRAGYFKVCPLDGRVLSNRGSGQTRLILYIANHPAEAIRNRSRNRRNHQRFLTTVSAPAPKLRPSPLG